MRLVRVDRHHKNTNKCQNNRQKLFQDGHDRVFSLLLHKYNPFGNIRNPLLYF